MSAMSFGRFTRVAGLVALLVVACAPAAPLPTAAPGKPAAEKALEKVSFRVDFVPQGYYAPFWLAYERGYYRENGLDVEILPGAGSLKTVELVAAKHLDIGLANSGVLAVAKSQGRPVRSVAMILNKSTFGFFVPQESDIRTIKDLEGRSLLTVGASPETVLLPAVYKLTGTDGSRVNQIVVDAAAKIPSYAQGQGDAMVTSIPFGAPVVNPQRPSRTLSWADAGFVLPDYGLLVHEDTIRERPDMIRRFVAASLRGWKEAPDNQDEALDALFKHWQDLLTVKSRDVAAQQLKGFLEYVRSPDTQEKPLGMHSEQEWKVGLETLKQYAGLQGSTDPKDFVTNEFVPTQ